MGDRLICKDCVKFPGTIANSPEMVYKNNVYIMTNMDSLQRDGLFFAAK